MPDNIRPSRSQSPERSDRRHRIEGQETQDQPRRSSSHWEITPTPEARECQSTGLGSQLRHQAEQHGVNIFGLSGPEMQNRRNQQVDQQASSSRDSHSESEELGQEPIRSQREREKLMELYLDLREAKPLARQPRSQSVHDGLQQLDQFWQDVLLIRERGRIRKWQ